MLLGILQLSISWGIVKACSCSHECSPNDQQCHPEQIHIAFGENPNDITITWSTIKNAGDGFIYYGTNLVHQNRLVSKRKEFTDDGPLKRKQWINVVKLKNLEYNTTYVYTVGSKYCSNCSSIFSFSTRPALADTVTALVYGDMGVGEGYNVMAELIQEVNTNKYDFVLHAGDLAYDLHHENGMLGDMFMNAIQPIAATVPYMVCPGNHEQTYNFSHYRNRFTMPGFADSMFYSFDFGPVHFVSVNTEAYYDKANYKDWAPGDNQTITIQYEWLQKDLMKANEPKNRLLRPWIIVYGHRPMYCTNINEDDRCSDYQKYIHRIGMEPLLAKYGVDLCIWAHQHSYERLWPLYNFAVYNGSYEKPYENPGAPVHYTSGSAGGNEGLDEFFAEPASWSAFRSSTYGYTRLIVHNGTHLHVESIATQGNETLENKRYETPKIIDEFWLVKTEHKPYSFEK